MAVEEENNICNESVFDKVYNSLVVSIRNFIFFKCGDRDRAYDIAQEAFIKLWQNCGKVNEGKARSFVYKVANNLFLNEVAHQKVVFKFKQEKRPSMDHQSPQFILEEKEYGEKIQRALAELSEVQRTAFLMSRVDGKKYREIAEILGISEKAAGKRISDALESLRKSIKNI
ncbi:MAG: RNA polymerase sigma factor [Bacteroidota bacterium]